MLAIAVVAASAGPANAGTPIQIGELAQADPGVTCTDFSAVQASVGGPPSYTVPSNGVITGWSHRGDDTTPGTGRLEIWRPAGGTSYTLVGRSVFRAFIAGEVNTFATSIPVSAGDLLGFRGGASGAGCGFLGASAGDKLSLELGSITDPAPGETRAFNLSILDARANVSATFDPADPPLPAGPTSLDSSATKGKQSAKKLKIKLTADQDSTLDIGGKGKIAQRRSASSSAKSKNYALKKKQGVALQAGVEKTVRVKFKKNNKTLKRIKKLQQRSKKARMRSKVIGNLTATTAAGLVTTSKVKIKLKP